MRNASLKGPTTARVEETETRSSGDLADSDPYHLLSASLPSFSTADAMAILAIPYAFGTGG